jgi:hypothetical protein
MASHGILKLQKDAFVDRLVKEIVIGQLDHMPSSRLVVDRVKSHHRRSSAGPMPQHDYYQVQQSLHGCQLAS